MTESQQKYNELFPDEKVKAKAFDELAEKYYFQNFGNISKSELDVLMFSIYIEKILEKDEENFNAYSDYTLSKLLGITQSKVSSLKIKKQLTYPYDKFDWKRSFERVLKNARFERNSIRVYIPDKNLFLELKNIIEINGGFIDTQLNSKLLKISVGDFINLLYEMAKGDNNVDIKKLENDIIACLKNNVVNDEEALNKINRKSVAESIREYFKSCGGNLMSEAAQAAVGIIELFTPLGTIGNMCKIAAKLIGTALN